MHSARLASARVLKYWAPGLALFSIAAIAAGPVSAQSCSTTRTVCASGCDHVSIQAAVDFFLPSLTGHSCVRIQDAGPYAEQVTVQNLSNAGFDLRIMAGTGVRPAVDPPAASTAAFQVKNASVNILGIDIKPTNAVPYGINASSAYVTISSVNVDSGGRITQAGVALNSWSAVSNSTVTVQAAHGLWVTGSRNTISLTTAVADSSSHYALYLNAASSNTITQCVISSGTMIDGGAAYNTIARSSMSSDSFAIRALSLLGSSSNTIAQNHISNLSNIALYVDGGGYNTVSQSTIASRGLNAAAWLNLSVSNVITDSYFFSSSGLILNSANNNTVIRSRIGAEAGGGVALSINGSGNIIDQSTITNSGLAYTLYFDGGQNNTVTRSLMTSPSVTGARFINSARGNTISLSTVISQGYAIEFSGASSNTVMSSYIQGSTAVIISGSTGTVLNSNALVGVDPLGSGLWMTGTSVNLSMSSNAIAGGAQGAGIYLDSGNKGAINISTNSVLPGARYGLFIATQTPGAAVWITSNTILPTLSPGQDTYGVYLTGLTSGATVQDNGIYYRASGSMGGFTTHGIAARSSGGLLIQGNRINQPGIVTGGGFEAMRLEDTDNSTVRNNDVHMTGSLSNAYGLRLLSGSTGIQVKNTVFLSSITVTGSSATASVDAGSQAGFSSDYNDFFSSNSANAAVWGATRCSLPDWVGAGCPAQDANSIAAHPLWANPAAGLEDFHPLSAAGRFNPATGLFVFDSISPATIDRGDPADSFGLEPAPNGGRINQGSHGNSAQASKSLAPPVANAQIAGVSLSSVTANWNVQPAASGYLLETSLAADLSSIIGSSATANVLLSTLTISNIAQDATYYFRAGSINADGIPNHVFVGSVSINSPPGDVVNLSTLAVLNVDDAARISWTAPGSNGFVGTAASYEIRYSTELITPANFSQASLWAAARPVGGPAGTVETELITGLAPGATYFFALRTRDAVPMISGLSNVPSYLTGADVLPGVVAYTPGDGQPGVAVSTAVAVRFTKSMSTDTFTAAFSVRSVLDKDGNALSQDIPWTVAFSTQTRTGTFTLGVVLGKNVTFEVRLTTDSKDLQGRPLTSSVTWRFSTLFDRTVSNLITSAAGPVFSIPAGAFAQDGLLFVSTVTQNAAILAANRKLAARDAFSYPAKTLDLRALDAGGGAMQPTFPLAATIAFDDANADGVLDGSNPPVRTGTLALWHLDEADQTWVRLPGGRTGTGTLSASIPHFSIFGLIGGEDTSLDNAFAFPVPYVPSRQATRVIKFQGLSSRATIKVFTVSGDLVQTIDEADGDGRAQWDVKNSRGEDAASGLYLFVIENGQQKKTGELIIVR